MHGAASLHVFNANRRSFMAITPFVTYDDLGNPVDSRKMAAGWSGKHNGIHAPASFESFSAAGTIKIGTATTAVASASSVGFKVVRRHQHGHRHHAVGRRPARRQRPDPVGHRVPVGLAVVGLRRRAERHAGSVGAPPGLLHLGGSPGRRLRPERRPDHGRAVMNLLG